MKDYPSQWINSGVTCRDVADRTTAYLEDGLPVIRKLRISLHLASCAGCRRYVKQIALISEAAARLPVPVLSAIRRLHLRRHFAAHYGPSPTR